MMICRRRSHWKARPRFFIGSTHTGHSGVIGSGERPRPPAVRWRSDGLSNSIEPDNLRAHLHLASAREAIFDCPVASRLQTLCGIWSKERCKRCLSKAPFAERLSFLGDSREEN